MKFIAKVLGMFFFLLLVNQSINAASLIGTTDPVCQTNHYVFRDQDTVQGFVDLCKGFTIIPATNHGSNIFMDTNVTVSGAIDLRGTSTLTLLRNLYLDEGVTFSDSGRIYSYGNALVMNGDLTIPADKVLHCGGNLIIDGNGNTLHIASGSQLFLDNYTTVTLRNMTIETNNTYSCQSALNISSNTSKLVMDNVILSLGNDLHVKSGQLFFHNDVVVTGTSALVYQSTVPSYIASHGCLMFDNGTTFSYASASINKDLIVLSDVSSTLVLNGCSLLATHTGLRLTKGRLYLDNKVMLNSRADEAINATTSATLTTSAYTGTGFYPKSCSWSSSGKYVALVDSNVGILQIFAFGGGVLRQVGSNVATGTNPNSCSWSPDEKYIAVVNSSSSTLKIYAFAGATPILVGDSVSTASGPKSCSWASDGRYVAVVTSGLLQVFSFTGSIPTQVGSNVATGAGLPDTYLCVWSPDGKYIAVVNNDTDNLQVFAFSGGTPTSVGGEVSAGDGPRGISWSPDGKYLAVVNFYDRNLKIFSFSGGAPSLLGDAVTAGSRPFSCSWSPDGKYVAVVDYIGSVLLIFSFSGGTPVLVGSSVATDTNPLCCSWSPNGKHVALVTCTSDTLQIFGINWHPDMSTQAMINGIVFGNSALGSTYDLDVHVLAGACVEINGKVFHDPA